MNSTLSQILVGSVIAVNERNQGPSDSRPPAFKAVGISLAVASGLFIGVSFVLKKKGLLKANVKYNEEAGEGYGYLKNVFWWTGMTLMIIGEICNFVAYAFVDAILVTPLGALSVVICTILSAIFLKERLSFVGKIGCFMCIVGSVVIVVNAPEQSSAGSIQEMKGYVIAPGFLSYAGVVLVGCAFVALWAGPRYGKRSMLVYLTVCSLIGGLSVVATQGLGAAVVKQISGTPQFNQWFLYVLFVFVIATLLTEIIYLNKALNIFNAALVTPTYYVYFTSATIVTSAILFRGFKGTPASIATVVMGFLQICSGVVLLQLSKSAKDVPDAAVFNGDLDQVRTVAEQEEPASEPKADTIRGAAAIIRQMSQSRQKMEAEEAKRIHDDQMRDLEPIREDEQFEWDGLRRRRTTLGSRGAGGGSLQRRKTLHPPLGLSRLPGEDDEALQRRLDAQTPDDDQNPHGMLGSFRRKTRNAWVHKPDPDSRESNASSPMHPVALTEIAVPPQQKAEYSPATARFQEDTSYDHARGGNGTPIRWADDVVGHERSRGTPTSGSIPPTPPPHATKRQFSFQHVFHRHNAPKDSPPLPTTPSSSSHLDPHHASHGKKGVGIAPRQSMSSNLMTKGATEEERLGLVKGDSKANEDEDDEDHPLRNTSRLADDDDTDSVSDDDWQIEHKPRVLSSSSSSDGGGGGGGGNANSRYDKEEEAKEMEAYVEKRRRWRESREAAQVSPGGSLSPPRGVAGRARGPPRDDYDDDGDQGEGGGQPGIGGAGGSATRGHAFL